MVEYNKENVKLSDLQSNKQKFAVINQTGVTLRMNIKMFNGNNLPHKLLLTNKYHLLCKCYWSYCRNRERKLYSCVFYDYRYNKETVKNNKK